MTLITTGVHFYIWRRLVRDARWPRVWRRIGTGLVVFLGLSVPLTMIFSRSLSPEVSRSLVYLPFVWMGMMMLLFWILLAIDVIKLISKIALRLAPRRRPLVDAEKRRTLQRLTAGGVVLTVSSLAGAAVYKGKLAPKHIVREVRLRRLPAALDGFRIAQITDLHIGNTLDGDWLDRVVAETNALEPDLIAITGDVIDGYVSHLKPQVAVLAKLRAPHGVFFVTGNHEYYSGVTEWIAAFEEFGIRVLRNEGVIISRGEAAFALAGVDDFNAKGMAPGHGPNLTKALAGIPQNLETVLLAHQPRAIFEAAEKGVGLILSGHTHGGQMWPITLMVGLQQPYTKGLYQHNELTQIYVSQGTGFWGPPMRLGTENELTEIRLRVAGRGDGE